MYSVKHVGFEKLSEVFGSDAYMDVVVYLNGNAYTVAASDTEAARKNHLVLKSVLGDRALKKLNDLRRALKVTGRAYTYLNEQHVLHPWKNLLLKEFIDGFGTYGAELTVNLNADAPLTLTETEGSAKLDLFLKSFFRDKRLKLFYYLARAFNVTGAADTNCDLNHNVLPLNVLFGGVSYAFLRKNTHNDDT